jgi:hypothetical protein
MLEYTAFSFSDPKKAAEMFAEDGAFELPYLATFGLPTQYRGRDAIAGFFQSVLDIYPGFQFENTKVLIDTPDQVFAEFEATAVSIKTGRTVRQLFFARDVEQATHDLHAAQAFSEATFVNVVFARTTG